MSTLFSFLNILTSHDFPENRRLYIKEDVPDHLMRFGAREYLPGSIVKGQGENLPL